MIQPKPCVHPSDALRVLAEAADRGHEQRGEDAHLHERVDPDGLEIGHGLESGATEDLVSHEQSADDAEPTSRVIATIASGEVRSLRLPPSAT